MTFVILACGSRDWTDQDAIADRLAEFADKQGVRLLHGAARGADRMAAEIANLYRYEVLTFPADWDRYGKRAGFLRNVQMLDEQPDLVLAFQRNGSRGTQHTIDEARRRGIPVEVHTQASPALIRIVAPHFVCGIEARNGRVAAAAPIVYYMLGWDGRKVADYCAKKGWTWERLS